MKPPQQATTRRPRRGRRTPRPSRRRCWPGPARRSTTSRTSPGTPASGTTAAGAGSGSTRHEFVVAQFLQHDSRDRDPQLHVHQAILNRILCADGEWRALDGTDPPCCPGGGRGDRRAGDGGASRPVGRGAGGDAPGREGARGCRDRPRGAGPVLVPLEGHRAPRAGAAGGVRGPVRARGVALRAGDDRPAGHAGDPAGEVAPRRDHRAAARPVGGYGSRPDRGWAGAHRPRRARPRPAGRARSASSRRSTSSNVPSPRWATPARTTTGSTSCAPCPTPCRAIWTSRRTKCARCWRG